MTATTASTSPSTATPAPPPAVSPGASLALAERAAEHADRTSRAVRAPRAYVLAAPARLAGEMRATPAARKKRPAVRPVRIRSGQARTPERARAAGKTFRKPAGSLRQRLVRKARTAPVRQVRVAYGAARAGAYRVLAFAHGQLGKPYVRGAAGPRAFDCSGLTMRAYARAGLRLAHKAARQHGRRVSLRQARPGDLVKWGSYHVGIYAGRGMVIHAPKPGDRVKKSRLWGAYRIVRVL